MKSNIIFPFTIKYKIKLSNPEEKIDTEALFDYISSYIKANSGRVIESAPNSLIVKKEFFSTPGDLFRPIDRGLFILEDGVLSFSFSFYRLLLIPLFFFIFFILNRVPLHASQNFVIFFGIIALTVLLFRFLLALLWYKDMLKEILKGFKNKVENKTT